MKMIKQLAATALLTIPTLCGAVQAYRTPQIFTQPDGTRITLSQRGDEYFHYYLTDDGQMVMSNGDGYYFAQPDASGRPVASSIMATDQAHRTQQQSEFLQGVSIDAMLSQGAKVANAKRSARDAQRVPQFRKSAANAASSWPSGIGLFPSSTYPVTGSPKALIILVQFKDVKFTYSNAKEYFTNFASQKGFSESNAHGSALDFFTAASNGKFTPDFDVLGPVTLSQNESYYGANDYNGNDLRPAHMIRDAVQLLDADYDFSVYDTDGDGVIDNVYCIFAGQGEASGGASTTIWPHSWDIAGAGLSLRVDGKSVRTYACSAEYLEKGLVDGIGTFCHEFSHVMGLPDLYTTDYNATAEKLTPGEYSIMDYGSYNNNSRTPPTYSIYERNAMGWADIEELKPGEARKASLDHMLKSNKGYVIATDDSNEFFLLENRQKSDWDAYIPGHGMLVWHIDYDSQIWDDNEANNSTHQYIDIVEAGGSANNTSSTTMGTYPFPGTAKKTSLTSSTSPALKSWSGKAIDVPLTNIKETVGGAVTFDVCGGEVVDAPICNYTSATVESESAVTVTLSLPSTAKEGDEIRYIYMYNDLSDIVEGAYSEPITIAKSCEFEFWTQRDEMQSAVKNIKFYIGETAPVVTSYRIVYRDNTSDSNQAFTTDEKYVVECEEGADIASFNTASNNIYAGSYGLKFSSSKRNGNLVLDINSDWQKNVSKVVINARAYGSDAASLSVNGSEAQSISESADYTYQLDGTTLTELKLSATKRIYVKSITFYTNGSDTPDPDPVIPTESYSHKIVFDDGGNEGTLITADNFTARCVEGGEIASFTEATRIYQGATGIKFGSAKGGGTLSFELSNDYKKLYTSIVVNAKQYGNDASSLTVNGTSMAMGSDFADIKYDITTPAQSADANRVVPTRVSSVTLASDKRLYVKSIEFLYDAEVTGVSYINTDNSNAEPEFYNLQGIRVDLPAPGQIYIMRQGSKVTKILVK